MGRDASGGGRDAWRRHQGCMGAVGGSSVRVRGGRGRVGRHEDTGTGLGVTLGGLWAVGRGWGRSSVLGEQGDEARG